MDEPRRWRWAEPVATLRAVLARGGLLAIPTESSYGLAADPRDPRAVGAVFRIKARDRRKSLPVVAADVRQLAALGVAVEEPVFRRLAAAWPAPLTLVVPLAARLPAAAGRQTLAVRVPAHERLRRLLSDLGVALTATSANLSGEPPVLRPDGLVPIVTGHDVVIVDDGPLPGGPPSTVVAVGGKGLTVLRRGRYPMDRLRRLAGSVPIQEQFSAATVEMSADHKPADSSPSRSFRDA